MSAGDFDLLRKLDSTVSRETFDALKAYADEIVRWNGRINLISRQNTHDIWQRHILDCVQLPRLKPDCVRWLDLGSGGGLPGLVIALMIRDKPGAEVHLIESNRKKTAFLVNVASKLNLPVKVHSNRIEGVELGDFKPQIVSARALAPLPALLEMSHGWLSKGATGMFMKGREFSAELSQTTHLWRFDLVEHESLTDRDGVIAEISDVKRVSGDE